MNLGRKILWIVFVICAIAIGLYPLLYWINGLNFGLPTSKSAELLELRSWQIAFYSHITFGGLALISGFSQFSKKLRNSHLELHRVIGKSYIICVFLSGASALYLAYYATGGFVTSLGFGSLAIAWLMSSFMAYKKVKSGDIIQHQSWMIRSYALTFAAVTLRFWLPFMTAALGWEFTVAYEIVSWLCWVPNIFVAEFIVQRSKPSLQSI